MIAVIETGGKQYTVKVGDVLKVETLEVKEGEKVVFSRVLLTSDGKTTEVGTPFLETSVEGKVLSHGRGDKIRVFKMKAKKRYQKTQGHRQNYTEVEIVKIGGAAVKAAPKVAAKKPVAKAEPKKTEEKKSPAAKKPATKKTAAKKKEEK